MKVAVAAVNAADWIGVSEHDSPEITRDELRAFLTCGVDVLDIRIASLKRGPSAHELALAKFARELGLEVRCHAWVGVRHRKLEISIATRKHGLVLGALAASAARALGASSFAANFEWEAWRGRNGGANPRAAEFMDGFAIAFLENAHGIRLDSVGFGDPSWHYGSRDDDADGRIDSEIPRAVRLRFVNVFVMAYQSTLAAIRARLKRAKSVWTDQAATRIEPWVGAGRINKKGQVVGSYQATLAIAREYGCVCLYVGFGAMGQLLIGHARHGSLKSLIQELKGAA